MNVPTLRRSLLLALAATLFTATGLARADDKGSFERHGGGLVRGSGRVVTEARSVAPFQAIHLKSSIKVVIRQSAKEALELRGDDNLLALVETTVMDSDGVPSLVVGSKKGASYTSRTPIVATVDVVNLKSVTISGSGDVMADALKAGELRVKVNGSGDVQLNRLSADELAIAIEGSGDVRAAGRSGKLSISIVGSGDVTTPDLQADEVSVSIAGSGDARVNARRTLAVSIAGSGGVDYSGDATVRTSIAGTGAVTKR